MAEINIERKKKPVWPWLLLLLIVALLIWAIFELTNNNEEVDEDEVAQSTLVLPGKPQQQLLHRA